MQWGWPRFDRDLLSPLLNLGWFVGCLVAGWCIGRPYKVAPVSLALTAVALSVPALSDQAGEARNDIVGIFFLLAAVAVALNAWGVRSSPDDTGVGEIDAEESEVRGGKSAGADSGLPTGALVVVGLAAGLAAGTKLNFLLPAGVLVVGLVADRAARSAGGGRSWQPALLPLQAAVTGTCETSPTPATRCPGSSTSARSRCPLPSRHWAGAKVTASSAT